MRIGLNTDSLGHLQFDRVLDVASELALDCVELPTGAWSSAPHVDLDALLQSAPRRDDLLGAVSDHGLFIDALTCSGNPLDPGPAGRLHDSVTRKTVTLARLLGVDRIVIMSGCPGGPGDANPNWITVAWPPSTTEILEWQWREVVIPYWMDLTSYARDNGIDRFCLELHGQQVVYNVPTLLRLREAVGPIVGVNLDPSHLMWMDADPLAAIRALGDAIYHVHAKDTRIEPERQRLTSRIETRPMTDAGARSWNYVTLGHGHDESFWRDFCRELLGIGYQGVLSIEHEDVSMDPVQAVRESADLLRRVVSDALSTAPSPSSSTPA